MLLVLSYISFSFITILFINTLINKLFADRLRNCDNKSNSIISILIPARNEEDNIANILEDCILYDRKNMEIIVCDDNSSDSTADIVKSYATRDPRIKLINAPKLPKGWKGKNHACHLLANEAHGNYLLFVDADVRICKSIIDDAILIMKKKHLALLSIFPYQKTVSFGEKISVPLMNFILTSLLPLPLVRLVSFSSIAAANGQFMLFKTDIYRKLLPHKIFKNSNVEDIEIARFYKNKYHKIACTIGEPRVTCRMYKSYSQAINGFSRNIFHFFGNKKSLAFTFWLLCTFGIVPIALYSIHLTIAYAVILIATICLYASSCKQNIILSIILFPFQLLFMLHLMINAMFKIFSKSQTWKGRTIN